MVRNAVFRRAELAARRDWRTLEELDQGTGWDAGRWQAAWAPYFAEHTDIGTGGAEGPSYGHWTKVRGPGTPAWSSTTPPSTTSGC